MTSARSVRNTLLVAALSVAVATIAGAQLKPTAVITGPTASGGTLRIATGASVFTADNSYSNPKGRPLTYQWTFSDDGTSSTSKSATHLYTKAGSSVLTLVVADGAVKSDPYTINIIVQPPPATPTTTSSASAAPPKPPGALPVALAVPKLGTVYRNVGVSTIMTSGRFEADERGNAYLDMGEDGSLVVSFYPIGNLHGPLPPGAYTVGVDFLSEYTGTISVLQGPAKTSPVLKTCPITANSITRCMGWANSGPLTDFTVIVHGTHGQIKGVLIDVP